MDMPLANPISVGLAPPTLAEPMQHTPRAFRDLARILHVHVAVIDGAAVLVLLMVALLLGFGLSRVFRRYALKYPNTWRELIFSLLESLPAPLLILAALYTALEEFSLPRRWEHVGSHAILVLVITVLFYFPARAITLFLGRISQKEPALERATQPATFLIQVLFAIVAVIVVLENLGVHLTAVWTTLGVGSVAVALALQDTLGNFFAGLYLLADHPVNLNDYIRLDSGQEGFVTRIGWRSTLLRTGLNNMVVVPNSTLAKAVITNFSFPEERLLTSVQVGVAYGTDPRRVEKLLTEIAGGLAQEGFDGVPRDAELSALLIPGFGASTLDFTLYLSVRRFADQGGVQSELRKRILERFAQEGIQMPFPTRALVLDPSLLDAVRNNPPPATTGTVPGVVASKETE
jgi:small-conductance mechanosensitive channel